MASTNLLPTTRISRSASDRPEIGQRRSTKASSSRTDSGKDTLPQAKIQALEQFVKFGRKGKQKEKEKETQRATLLSTTTVPPVTADSGVSTPARRRRETSQTPHRADPTSSQFPRPMPEVSLNTLRPGTAGTGVDIINAAGTSTLPSSAGHNGGDPSPSIPGAHEANPLLSISGTPDGEEQVAPEPLTLARRIQTLLSLRTVPPTPSATDATTSGAASSEAAAPITPSGSIPPAPVAVTDSRFLALLGNTNAMSGSLDKGRQSVFAILDRLRRPSGRAVETSNDPPSSMSEEEEQENEEYDDGSSIMLYGPLVPDEDSEVELAASDIMSVFDDGETLEFERPARPLSFFDAGEQLTPRSPPVTLPPPTPEERYTQEASSIGGQPDTQKEPGAMGWFDTWKGKMIEGGKLVSEKVAEGTKSWKDKMSEGRKVVKTKTRWVPSPNKISFQATWWGYRLYLPPPVLDVLNNKRLEAAKRAAILTTALQWLLGQVPLTVVPPQFRPGLLVAQRLVPYLGYVGGFVAWSWGAMKSFDKGHGIVLTATWLLPVALIPGTWEANEAPDATRRPPDARARSPPEASTSSSNSAPET
ncbi:hypothetical protein EDB89DRAFT_953833 [Lactarius sanguifluus]|nr:hypothetical protein EDB89DRAFT_953833 [Lactarius sanguifluus]